MTSVFYSQLDFGKCAGAIILTLTDLFAYDWMIYLLNAFEDIAEIFLERQKWEKQQQQKKTHPSGCVGVLPIEVARGTFMLAQVCQNFIDINTYMCRWSNQSEHVTLICTLCECDISTKVPNRSMILPMIWKTKNGMRLCFLALMLAAFSTNDSVCVCVFQ